MKSVLLYSGMILAAAGVGFAIARANAQATQSGGGAIGRAELCDV
jgi:hypothetical protein